MNARSTLALRALATAVTLLASSTARAEFPHPDIYIGVYGGYDLKLREWDFGDHASQSDPSATDAVARDGYQAKGGGIVGLRLGVQALSWLALEGAVAYMPINDNRDNLNHALSYELNVLFHLLPHRNWTPVIEAGVGGYTLLYGQLGGDTDPRVHVGIGLRGLIHPRIAFRVDIRDVISDGFPARGTSNAVDFGSNNLELLVGFDFFSLHVKPPVVDADGDGVLDKDDACPSVAGPAENKGCPWKDSDGDGVVDKDDACPDVAGPVDNKGCPWKDSDGDGVLDKDDACPDVAAGKIPDPVKKGCPSDKDGDGVIDESDQCVDVPAGKFPDAAKKGCPADRDADGVIDEKDQCVDVPTGKVPDPERAGCPADKDKDSVPDEVDACPDKVGAPDPDPKKNGCPGKVKIENGQIVILEQVFFETGSDQILKKSNPVLDAVANAIKSLPEGRKIRVEGHTDSKGDEHKNQALSEKRAAAVEKYLEGNGIPDARIVSKGFGQSKPIADNNTPEGRAKNRRVEFHIVEGDAAE